MPLSCGCDYAPEPGQVWTEWAEDFSVLGGKRAKKCCNCGGRIPVGSTVAEFPRFKSPEHPVEERIYGEEGQIERAPVHLCETCAGLWFSLSELGYDCVGPWEVTECMAQYRSLQKSLTPPIV